MSEATKCERCGRVPKAHEVEDFGGCGCQLLHGRFIAPSPYSNDFLTHCSRCGVSVITWDDLNGDYSWYLCGCGLSSDYDHRKADEGLERLLQQKEDREIGW
jgi:hypothetical protein